MKENRISSVKKYYEELNILRGLIIVWVVIGHSFSSDNTILGFLNSYAYSFHMSAFFALSGLLFYSKIKKIKTLKDVGNTIWDRFKRLIVPYLFFTFISYVLKYFLESYANNELSNHIFLDTLLGTNNPNGGIWFLHSLFILSVIAVLVYKIPTAAMSIITLILKITVSILDFSIPIVTSFCEYSVFFFAGIFISKYYDNISCYLRKVCENVKKKRVLIICSVLSLIISFALTYYLKLYNENTHKLILFVLTIFNIVVWYFAAYSLSTTQKAKKAPALFGKYGMDIYMLGYYVQTAIRVVLGTMLGAPYIVYSLLMCVLGLLLPIPISKYIVRKIKLAKMLMLGEFTKKDK